MHGEEKCAIMQTVETEHSGNNMIRDILEDDSFSEYLTRSGMISPFRNNEFIRNKLFIPE
jgi:hypothetical protein